MTASDKTKALAIITDPEALLAVRSAFSESISDLVPSLQDMMDSLETGDLHGFHVTLQQEIDNPAFDAAFEQVCSENPQIANEAMEEALRGVSTSGMNGSREGWERVSDIFVIPVTGPVDELARFAMDAGTMSALERAFSDVGLMTNSGRVVLSDTLVRPDVVVNATPGTLRDLFHCFQRFFWSSGGTIERAELEADVADFETFCHPDGYVSYHKGTSTLLLIGLYSREYDLREQIEEDALTVQIIHGDANGEFADALASFKELASDLTGLEVSLPHWLGKGCAASALETVRASMKAEASFYGIDLAKAGMDGVAIATRGDLTIVEGEVAGHTLGPFSFDNRLAVYEADWIATSLEQIAKTVLHPGHLISHRSAGLN